MVQLLIVYKKERMDKLFRIVREILCDVTMELKWSELKWINIQTAGIGYIYYLIFVSN